MAFLVNNIVPITLNIKGVLVFGGSDNVTPPDPPEPDPTVNGFFFTGDATYNGEYL